MLDGIATASLHELALTSGEIADGDAVEDLLRCALYFVPDLVGGTALVAFVVEVGDGREGAFEGLDDLGEADLLGGADEGVAALRAADAADEAGLAEGGEKLIEVGSG